MSRISVYNNYQDFREHQALKLRAQHAEREAQDLRAKMRRYMMDAGEKNRELAKWQNLALEQIGIVKRMQEEKTVGTPPAEIPKEGMMRKWKTRGKWLLLGTLWVAFFSLIGPVLMSARSFVEPMVGLLMLITLVLSTVAIIEAHNESKGAKQ